MNGFPYLGKNKFRPTNQPLSEHDLRLTVPYIKKGRKVITNNFFTSSKLAEKLQAQNSSLVRTMKRIGREIPMEVRNSRENRYNSYVLKNNQCTLTVS